MRPYWGNISYSFDGNSLKVTRLRSQIIESWNSWIGVPAVTAAAYDCQSTNDGLQEPLFRNPPKRRTGRQPFSAPRGGRAVVDAGGMGVRRARGDHRSEVR